MEAGSEFARGSVGRGEGGSYCCGCGVLLRLLLDLLLLFWGEVDGVGRGEVGGRETGFGGLLGVVGAAGMVPVLPCVCEDGLEGCELLVCHVEGTEEVLLEEGRAGKGEEEGGGKGLAAGGRVGEGRLVDGVGGQVMWKDMGVVGVGVDAVVDVVEGNVVADLALFALLDECAVFALALAGGGTDPVAACDLVGSEIRGRGILVGVVVDVLGTRLGLGLGRRGRRMEMVVEGQGEGQGLWGDGVVAVALALSALTLGGLFPFQPLGVGLVVAGPFAARARRPTLFHSVTRDAAAAGGRRYGRDGPCSTRVTTNHNCLATTPRPNILLSFSLIMAQSFIGCVSCSASLLTAYPTQQTHFPRFAL